MGEKLKKMKFVKTKTRENLVGSPPYSVLEDLMNYTLAAG